MAIKKKKNKEPAAEWVKISELKLWDKNPRVNDHVVDRIADSLKKFGWGRPIVVRKANKLIMAGNTTIKAAIKLGLDEAPVRFLDVSQKVAVQYALADNKLGELAEWDFEKLEDIFVDFEMADLELAGFSLDEINELKTPDGEYPDDENETTPILKNAELDDLAPTHEEIEKIKGRKILVEFSGGKDSSAVSIWAKHHFPENECELLFCDMGADHISLPLFLHKFSSSIGVTLRILRAPKTMHELFIEKGKWPHFAFPYCHELLYSTINTYIRTHPAEEVIIMRGGRMQERIKKRKTLETRFREIPDMKEYIYFEPLYFADKKVGESIVEKSGQPLWVGYETGLQRTACRICPGQSTLTYSTIRSKYPDVWNELLWFEQLYGSGVWQSQNATFDEMADRGDARLQ